ncbi:MAG TPA: hypothetical protein VE973_00590, partial [Candidatus Limnocylindria bacterium]|nr:hypothetical protein [Candidatus Limnocylindria bacterium]
YIYNEDFLLRGKARNFLKKILGSAGGPEAVFESLLNGLKELNINYTLNTRPTEPIEYACVLNGVKTLEWAISQKQKGLIKKIIAGPNLVVTPFDENAIIKHPAIDKIVVPSQWVKDFYISEAPELANKIHIWAAGVNVPKPEQSEKKLDFLIFYKSNPGLYKQVADYLSVNNYKFSAVVYGKYDRAEYFRLLSLSKFVIYLSDSESQGLAMFEAWARNVPTFVWERGFMQSGKHTWQGNTASPYLTNETGRSFRDFKEFESQILNFISGSYSPKQYIEQNFTYKISAQKYLDTVYA